MDPIKKILVAVGVVKRSQGLLTYASRIAERLNAELIIVNIINIRDVEAIASVAAMGYEIDSEHYVSGIKEERRQALDDMLAPVSFPTDKLRTIFRVGHPVDELLKIAVQENVDLMVMGIKGRSELEHILVGSVAEKIFRRSPVPVLSYRDAKSVAQLKKHIGFK